HLVERLQQRVRGHYKGGLRSALDGGERDQQVLGGDVLVPEPEGPLLSLVQDVTGPLRQAWRLHAAATRLRQPTQLLGGTTTYGVQVGAGGLEEPDGRPLGLREQRGQQVNGFHGRVARRGGLADRDRQGFPGQRRQPLNVHLVPAFQAQLTAVTG